MTATIYTEHITENLPHPHFAGRGITIQNLGTHVMYVGTARIAPASVWIGSNDSRDYFHRIPPVSFDKKEAKEFENIDEDNLPMQLQRKGVLASAQYIIDHTI